MISYCLPSAISDFHGFSANLCQILYVFYRFSRKKITYEGFRASTPFCESSRTSNLLQTRDCSCPATVALCIHQKNHISRCEWADRMYISSSLSIAKPFGNMHNITILQYCTIVILHYCDIGIPRYCNTTILQYYNIAVLQYHRTTARHYHTTTIPQCHRTTIQQYYNTTVPP